MDSHRVHLLRFLGGAIAAFYGRHFTHILLYASLVLHTDGRYALLYDRLLKQVHELGTLSRDAWRALNEVQLRAAGTAALEHAGRVSTLREQLARARACGNHHVGNASHNNLNFCVIALSTCGLERTRSHMSGISISSLECRKATHVCREALT